MDLRSTAALTPVLRSVLYQTAELIQISAARRMMKAENHKKLFQCLLPF